MRQVQLRVVAADHEAALVRLAARRLGRSVSGWGREILLEAARAVLEASPAREQGETHERR